MTSSPRVSFITPAYNAADTIGRTIESIREQTIADWEWRIVDDGSSDDTFDRLTRAADVDSRIKLARQSNAGPASARNRAIREAQGAWLMFHDADDWLRPDFLARMLAAAESRPDAALVACTFLGVDEAGAPLRTHWVRDLSDPFPELARTCPFSPIAVLVRREAVQRLGGFDERLITCEDWDLWQRLARQGAPFVTVRDSLAYYRSRPGSLTRKTQRLIADSQVVIRRGHGEDPRADGRGAYAGGCDPAGLTDALAHSALYFAATGLCIGGEPEACFAHLPDLSSWDFDSAIMADVIVDAAAYGLAADRAALARDWSRVAMRFDALIEALRTRGLGARRADTLRALIEANVRGVDAFRDGFASETVSAVSLDLSALPAHDLAGAEAIVGSVTGAGIWLGAFERSASDGAIADGVAAVLRAAPAGKLLRGTRAVANPAFWAQCALKAPSLAMADDRGAWVRRAVRSAAARPWRPREPDPPARLGEGPRAATSTLILLRSGAAPLLGAMLAEIKAAGCRVASIGDWARAAQAGSIFGRLAMIAVEDRGDMDDVKMALAAAGVAATVFSAQPRADDARFAHGWLAPMGVCALAPSDLRAAGARAMAMLPDDGHARGVLFAGGRPDGVVSDVLRRVGFSFGIVPVAGKASIDADPFALHCVTIDAFTPAQALAARLDLRAAVR